MIEWNHAGRPRKKHIDLESIEEQCSEWTKAEKTIVQDGVVGIAMAVVQRWVLDGKPKKDIMGVMPWVYIIEDSLRKKNLKQNKQRLELCKEE